MEVQFFTIKKEPNSLAIPSSKSVTVQCDLLSPCSVLHPSILLDPDVEGMDPTIYNFAHIPEWGRYYWITDWGWTAGLWNAALSVDPLASWREGILGSSQYILRNSNDYNGDLVDTMYPSTAAVTKRSTQVPGLTFTPNLNNGMYIIGIVGEGEPTAGMGAVSYYMLTPRGMKELGKTLFSDAAWLDVQAGEQAFVKTQFNPLQYIVSCKWFPFQKFTGGSVAALPFGWWTLPINAETCQTLFQGNVNFSGTAVIPTHPQQTQRGYYLNLPPYARYTLFAQCFGQIPLDGTYFVKDATLTFDVDVDLISGEATLEVKNSVGTFASAKARMGVDISLAQLANQAISGSLQVVGGAAGAIASGIAGNVAGVVSGAATAISGAFEAALPQMARAGSNGSRSDYLDPFSITSQFYTVAEDDPMHLGRPLCQIRQLKDLTGFTMVSHPQVQLPATREELDAITAYLEGGVYIE